MPAMVVAAIVGKKSNALTQGQKQSNERMEGLNEGREVGEVVEKVVEKRFSLGGTEASHRG